MSCEDSSYISLEFLGPRYVVLRFSLIFLHFGNTSVHRRPFLFIYFFFMDHIFGDSHDIAFGNNPAS